MKFKLNIPYTQIQVCRATGTVYAEIEAETKEEAIKVFNENWDGFYVDKDGVSIDLQEDDLETLETEESILEMDDIYFD